jgi:hypothetical protein
MAVPHQSSIARNSGHRTTYCPLRFISYSLPFCVLAFKNFITFIALTLSKNPLRSNSYIYLAVITLSKTTFQALKVPLFGLNPCCQLGRRWLNLVIRNHVTNVMCILQTGDGTPRGRSFPFGLGIYILVISIFSLHTRAISIAPNTHFITRCRGNSRCQRGKDFEIAISENTRDCPMIIRALCQ